MSISSEDIHSNSSEAKKIRTSDRIQKIGLEKLKELFESQDLLSLKLSDTRIKLEDKPPSYGRYEMSPFTKRIYDSLTTAEKPRFRRDIELDNAKIDLIEKMSLDEAYNPEEQMYDYLEYFISYFFRCPVCRQISFRKYANISMPVIDVVCINKYHPENKTRYFQIKTTNGSEHFFEPYFSKTAKFIKVGSNRFGYNIHNISNKTDIKYQNLQIGYICIQYIYDERLDHIKINYDNSFYIVPKLLDRPYYTYLRSNKISFSGTPGDIRDIYDDIKIPKYFFFIPRIKTNPLMLSIRQPKFGDDAGAGDVGAGAGAGMADKYYKLYIKYKIKYLRLKILNMENKKKI
jgi:hypothetical protein